MYTLAYPTLTEVDREWIEAFRHRHDKPYRDLVTAHFTLVFGIDEISEDHYCTHVKTVAKAGNPIEFYCRYAMLGADHETERGYVFLVPDEGYGSISCLHDRLYSDLFAPMLRLDLPFTPHMTIGTLEDRSAAKNLCDRLNADGISIAGSLESLAVCALDRNRIVELERFSLGA